MTACYRRIEMDFICDNREKRDNVQNTASEILLFCLNKILPTLHYRVSTLEITPLFVQMLNVTLWFLKKCHSLIFSKLVQIALVKQVLGGKKQLFCVVSRTFTLFSSSAYYLNFLNSLGSYLE